ncbi:MAG: helix-turn-helix transcriptional regulator [Prolixibacteraceae bacterium]|nr:helix-turn-helix transcriptional regulator [Prolixibacteraceae bacterium]
MSVKLRLSAFLELNKISQKEISELLGIKPGTISGIISGKSKITTDQLAILAAHFNNLDLRWLLTGEESIPIKSEDGNISYYKNNILNVANEPCANCAILQKKIDNLNDKYIYLLENGVPKKEIPSTSSKKIG